MTDLEWILKRLNAITTGSKTPDEQLQTIKELIEVCAEQISLKFD